MRRRLPAPGVGQVGAQLAGRGAWKEEKRSREGEEQGRREEAEAEEERRRETVGEGVSRQGRGENKGVREITVLPFPSLFHLFDSPYLTLLV